MGLFSGASAGVRLDADSTGYRRELKRAQRETKQTFGDLKKQTGGLRSAFKSIGVGLGAGMAVAVGAVIKTGAQGIGDMSRLLGQTDAVIKSTGGAAGVTVGHIDKLSTAIERATGVEAENIIAGQNMLLTFTNVRNGVGKNNAIFDDATGILTDMSVAMGVDAKSQAIQLGKALNDPIKGVGALSRVGVTFTEGQKKSIKAMQDAGNTAGAQKIILAELRKEFGGSAAAFGETMPGQIAKAKNAFGNLSETLVAGLVPAFNAGLSKVNSWIARMQVWAATPDGRATLTALADGARKVGSAIGVAAGLLAKMTKFLIDHRAVVVPAVAVLLSMVAAYKAFVIISTVVKLVRMLTAGQIALNIAMIANPIGLVVAALVGIGVALVIAWKKFDTFRNVVKGVWGWIKSNWPKLLIILTGPIGIAVALIVKNFDKIAGFVKKLPGRLAAAGKGMWNWITDGLRDIASGAGAIGSKIANGIIRAVNNLLPDKITMPGKIPDIDLPNDPIPYMARGGRLRKATLLVAGEDGDEQVVPLSKKYRREGIANWLDAGRALGVPMFARGGRTRAPKRLTPAQMIAQQLAAAGSRATVAASPSLGAQQAQAQLAAAAAATAAAQNRVDAEKDVIATLERQRKSAKAGSAQQKKIDAQLAKHKAALAKNNEALAAASGAQAGYADSVVSLRQQVEADAAAAAEEQRRLQEEAAAAVQEQARSAAGAAFSFADAEANLAAARAEATETLADDVASAQQMLALAGGRAAAIEAQLARGDLTAETRTDLVNQLAEATRAQTSLRERITDLNSTMGGDGTTGSVTIDPVQMQQLIASNDAFLAGLRDTLRSERSNITIAPTFTQPQTGVNQFLETMRYKLTQAGAGGAL